MSVTIPTPWLIDTVMDALKKNRNILQNENNIILFPIYETILSPEIRKCRYSGEGCIEMY